MSVIRVDNFGPSAGGTTYSARGIAKAWSNLNGTGTIALRDSLNIASVVDRGTGDYTNNLTSSMANTDYSIGGDGNQNQYYFVVVTSVTLTSSAYAYGYYYAPSATTDTDVSYAYTLVHGDLA